MTVRISTGISGMDKLIEGGFNVGDIILISGGTGTGKTIFGLQFLYNNKDFNGLYISFEESKEDLFRDGKQFGWDLEGMEKAGKLKVVYYPPFEFDKLLDQLEDIIVKTKAKRIVIDSASIFGLYVKDLYELRRKIYKLSKVIKKTGCTCLVISEIVGESSSESIAGKYSRFGVEEFVADGVIIFHYTGLGGDFDRTVQVLKMRRTNQKRGLFPMKIGKKGIVVKPNVSG
ncbi:MAG: hypothetical protein GOU97_02365 [Nanoarchaeota archaeon]|nr:hypothetical protein [Nanoarchaeota archaeon]